MKPLFNGHTAHSEIWPLHLTHPSTRSLVLRAVGSYCTAPGEQWEWGGRGMSGALLKGTMAGHIKCCSKPTSVERCGGGVGYQALKQRICIGADLRLVST